MKTIVTALALAVASLAATAADYFVVVPIAGKTVNTSAIAVALDSTTALPTAIVGLPYAGYDLKPLLRVSGDPGYTGYGVRWTVVQGALPAGLALDAATGVITGTATSAAASTVTVQASYMTKTGVQAYQLTSVNLTVTLSTVTLPSGTVGAAYSYDFKPLVQVSGDASFTAAQATWSIDSGSFPAGLTFNANGTVTGSPLSTGTATVTLRASYRGKSGAQAYQLVTVVFPTPLLLHLDGNTTDSSTANRVVTVRGTAPTFSPTDAQFGQSAVYNGTGYHCLTAFNMLEAGTNNFTIELWAKLSAYQSSVLIAQHQYGSALGFYLAVTTNGALTLVEDPSSYTRATSAGAAVKLGVWQHIAMVRNNGTVIAYVDGKQVFTTTTSVTTFYSGNATYGGLSIGGGACNTTWAPLTGKLDEVRITQGARYTGAFTPPAAPGN